ncbi:uncharacterized protein EV422DRAFT_98225 [Fimicolochytrium jonesii]|uniref:uncharacterized protein n=1 Tax=Fimicolochytrium jonesii TaxID=1396493 RepID=UPI0022FEA9D8|nr:uncharacterized protein EV422DRAFT_98225 [Fimicolochytrium jonesii]KAI8819589.1 hypothetical protein EV422DRAFT_98225 [Fimicolochytrium jonesii]
MKTILLSLSAVALLAISAVASPFPSLDRRQIQWCKSDNDCFDGSWCSASKFNGRRVCVWGTEGAFCASDGDCQGELICYRGGGHSMPSCRPAGYQERPDTGSAPSRTGLPAAVVPISTAAAEAS